MGLNSHQFHCVGLDVSLLYGTLIPRLVGVAQLVRAPGCGPGGRGFETPRSPQSLPRACVQTSVHTKMVERRLGYPACGSPKMSSSSRAFSSVGRATDS